MAESGGKILVVDDDRELRLSLFEALGRRGHEVLVAENGQMALALCAKNRPDLVVTDIRMPEMDGLEFLRRVRVLHPHLPVIIITAFATVDNAVEAMRLGAEDYLLKPFPAAALAEAVERALREAALRARSSQGEAGRAVVERLEVVRKKPAPVKAIVGQDERWLKVLAMAEAVASSKATVLVLGESGTGKEVLARHIHEHSSRSGGPFVALNCAALPEGLLESELFGHEKGAFTGAIGVKKGKFELAEGGTLLLDEIGEIPLHLQAKLLRVLQEEEVDRVGGRTPVKIDVHVIATTNRDLSVAAQNGEFRQDLYYRLNVIPLRLPPLRERRQDILLLAAYFVEKYAGRYAKEVKPLSPAAQRDFLAYNWPGNVRELENMVERAVLLSSGPSLEPWDFRDDGGVAAPAAAAGSGSGSGSSPAGEGVVSPLHEVERQMIIQALQQTGSNRTHAAKMLGISVRTLRNKLHEYRGQGFVE